MWQDKNSVAQFLKRHAQQKNTANTMKTPEMGAE